MTRRSLAVVLAAVLWTAQAAAQEPPPEPYVAKFVEGRALVKREKYAEALEKFKESLALKPASGTLLNIGDCYEKLGRYASAMEAFEKALELAAEAKQPEREKEASDRAGKLQSLVSTVTITTASKDKEGAFKVTLDGNAATLGQAISVDGGPHVVRVEMTCKKPKDINVTVAKQSDAQSVAVDPGALEADPACAPKPAATGGMSTERLLSFVAGGAAVVSLGVGVGFGIGASGKSSDLEVLCPTYPTRCPASQRGTIDDTYDSATTFATISTVGFIAAIVFAGGAAALYFISPEWKQKKATGWVPGRLTF